MRNMGLLHWTPGRWVGEDAEWGKRAWEPQSALRLEICVLLSWQSERGRGTDEPERERCTAGKGWHSNILTSVKPQRL